MWNLEVIARNALKLSETDALKVVTNNKSIQFQAIRLNRSVQLYEYGVGVDGKGLRSIYARFGNVYANKTIAYKLEKDQPINRVTLRDTGKFYSTFNTKVMNGELWLTASTIKDGQDLQDSFGQVVGLTSESKSELIQQAKPLVLQYVKSKVLQ
jgi:hypothetical protein